MRARVAVHAGRVTKAGVLAMYQRRSCRVSTGKLQLALSDGARKGGGRGWERPSVGTGASTPKNSIRDTSYTTYIYLGGWMRLCKPFYRFRELAEKPATLSVMDARPSGVNRGYATTGLGRKCHSCDAAASRYFSVSYPSSLP